MNLESKKKILYIITKGNWGGAQRYVFDLAVNLPKDSFEPIVAMGDGDKLSSLLEEKGVRTIRIESLGRDAKFNKDFKAFFEIISILKKEKPDIVHLNSSKIGILGAFAARAMGIKKIIFTAHGWAFNENRPLGARLIIKYISYITVLLCHQTIAVSEKTKKDIMGAPFISKKLSVIYNGAHFASTEPKEKAREILKGENQISEKFWIGTISELHKNKGLDIAIQSFSKIKDLLPEAVFLIIGSGEEKNNLEKLVEDLGLKEKVFFLGHIPNASTLLKAFDIFTLTSRTEALPYVLLEAGNAELPVIASSVGGIPEIIEDGKSGILVEKENIDKFTEALLYLGRNQEAQKQFAKALNDKIKKHFSLEMMLQKTNELYR